MEGRTIGGGFYENSKEENSGGTQGRSLKNILWDWISGVQKICAHDNAFLSLYN